LVGEVQEDALQGGVFKSVKGSVQGIMDYIESNNESLKPFTWTAKADDLLAKIGRAKVSLNKMETA